MNRYYQDGQVYRRGKRVKKWKERLRIYYDDGSVKRPEVVLGFCSRMAKSEARTKLRQRMSRSGSNASPVVHGITYGACCRTTTFGCGLLSGSGGAEPTQAVLHWISEVLDLAEHGR